MKLYIVWGVRSPGSIEQCIGTFRATSPAHAIRAALRAESRIGVFPFAVRTFPEK